MIAIRRPHRDQAGALIARERQDILRIAELERLRAGLTQCIGCGCLTLKVCALYNPDDLAAARGAGPRYLLGDP